MPEEDTQYYENWSRHRQIDRCSNIKGMLAKTSRGSVEATPTLHLARSG